MLFRSCGVWGGCVVVSVEAVEGAGVVASISGFKSPLNANAPTAMAAQAAAAAMPTDFLLSFIGWGFVSVCALSAELVIKALLSIFCRIASRFSDLLSLWDFFIISVIFIALFLLFTVCFFQLVKGAV